MLIRIVLWRCVAAMALVLASIGVVLPGLPTVPFLILAAWAGGRGWPALEQRLLAHPTFGETLRAWRERQAIPRRAKWLACALMLVSSATLWLSPAPVAIKLVAPLFFVGVAVWLWSRPDV